MIDSGMSSNNPKIKDSRNKASFYVIFLGTKECLGLRGDESVRPSVKILMDRTEEPSKVTLQISSKGIRVVQTVFRKNSKCRLEDNKHLIPANSLTYVIQEPKPNDDVVSCVVFMYNPSTRSPLHVNAFRCDSADTASVLRKQILGLIERPEQQRRISELEKRLRSKGLLPEVRVETEAKSDGSIGSQVSSESGGESEKEVPVVDEKVKRLYNNLAAELKEKLNGRGKGTPILLPPRDYDTMHRQHGRLDGIGTRRSLNIHVVGATALKLGEEGDGGSSAKSSGIGSDEAPGSPVHERDSNAAVQEEICSEDEDNPTEVTWSKIRKEKRAQEERVIPEQLKTRELSESCRVDGRSRYNSRSTEGRDKSREEFDNNVNKYAERWREEEKKKCRLFPPSHPPSSDDYLEPLRSPNSDSRSRPNAQRLTKPCVRTKEPRTPSGSPPPLPRHRYVELPPEKRYPGLDRDTAAPPPLQGRQVDHSSNVRRRVNHHPPYSGLYHPPVNRNLEKEQARKRPSIQALRCVK